MPTLLFTIADLALYQVILGIGFQNMSKWVAVILWHSVSQLLLWPESFGFAQEYIYSFIQQIFAEHLLCVRDWGCSSLKQRNIYFY